MCIQDKRERTIRHYMTKNEQTNEKKTMNLEEFSFFVYKIFPTDINIHSQLEISFAPVCITATVDEEACAKQGSV